MFHTVGLIFVNCQNYNTSARLVGLLREITNDIIDIVRSLGSLVAVLGGWFVSDVC